VNSGSTSTRLPVIAYTHTQVYEADPAVLEEHRILSPDAESAATSAMRMLRTQVLQRMDERGFRTLAVTSPTPGDGKSTVAANLAIAIASDYNHTALLVDLNLRNPAVAQCFGLTPTAGIDDVLMGRASVEDALYHPSRYERLVLMPARAALQSSSEVLMTVRAREIVEELKQRYPDRIIIFDLPPLLVRDDAAAFMPLVDAALLVLADGRTRKEDVHPAMSLLRNTPVVGTVLNRAGDLRQASG
jgi:capsular exopolysaccharide synthesis family protein